MPSDTRNSKPSSFQVPLSGTMDRSIPPVGGASPQVQPAGEPPAAPAEVGIVPAAWLNLAFPDAAAREEQIRRAAQGATLQSRPPASAPVAGEGRPQAPADMTPKETTPASSASMSPKERWEALRGELAAHRPADRQIGEAHSRERPPAATEEHARSALDPLIEAAEAQDWQGFAARLMEQFAILASVRPWAGAIAEHERMLLHFGPRNAAFQAHVSRTTGRFLVDGPRRSAGEVENALKNEGPLGAAAELRRLTDPETVDPLTAGQIFGRSEQCIDAIANHLCAADYIRPYATSGTEAFAGRSPVAGASASYARLGQLFCDLNAAADSASRSEYGRQAVKRLARLLRDAPIDTLVTASISNGDGVFLPLEIVRLHIENASRQAAAELALLVQVGLRELRDKTRGAVIELDDTASLFVELTREKAEKQGPEYSDLAREIDALLTASNRYGYALVRAMRAVAETGPWLDHLTNCGELRRLTTVPDEREAPELAFALGATPASLTETLRQDDADPAGASDAGALDPRLQDLDFAVQWFGDFRQFLGAARSEVA